MLNMKIAKLFYVLIFAVGFMDFMDASNIIKRNNGDKQDTFVSYELLDLPTVDISKFPKDSEGWITLFDGKTFNGWRGYNRTDIPEMWCIANGSIHIRTTGTGGAGSNGGDILFAYKFKNFEFEVEWKAAKGANSGIHYFIQEVKGESASQSAPECQILDNENHGDAKAGRDGNRQASSLYDLVPAKPQNAKPFGEWNKIKIRCKDGEVTHFQNGVAVVKYRLWSPEWKKMLDVSKWSKDKNPIAYELLMNCGGPNREGFIGFQDHGDKVWFRNIRVRIL